MKTKLLKFFFQSKNKNKKANSNDEFLTIKGEKRQIKKSPCIKIESAREENKNIEDKTCLSKYFSCLKGLNFYERNGYNNGTLFARESELAIEYNRKEYQQSLCFYR